MSKLNIWQQGVMGGRIMKISCVLGVLCILFSLNVRGQAVPAPEENIPHLITFGNSAPTSWGDDDFCQVFFFLVPKENKAPVFFRVFDPDCGGRIDEAKLGFNTVTTFSIYGGKEAYSHKDARATSPKGNFRSGNQLATKSFGEKPQYDEAWYTFGPFNPTEGEYLEEFQGYLFKVIAEGISGDDGNLYNYFMSTSGTQNIPIEGGNAFTFEYSFRLSDNPRDISHIYPFVDDRVISIKQSNFDWDSDGYIRIISVAKKGELIKASGDDNWYHSEHKISEQERNTSLDIQFIKHRTEAIKNNNVVLFVTNQYGEFLPFYTVPIGGIPRFKPNIGVRKISR